MKHIIFKISLAILLAVSISGVHAAGIKVRIPALTGVSGNTIDVPVYADSSLTGKAVFSYQFLLNYNTTRLQPVAIIVEGTLSQIWGIPVYSFNNSKISLANAGGAPLAGIGVLFYIRFNMIAAGNATINFDGGTLSNYFNEGQPPMILQNGQVTISSPPSITISPNEQIIIKGEQIQFTVSGGTAPYSWFVTNPAIAAINASGLLTGNNEGFTKVVVVDAAGIRDTTNGFIEVRVARIFVENFSAYQGTIVDVPIYVSDLSGEGITAGYFKMNYSSSYLQAVGFNRAGTMLEPFGDPAFSTYDGGLTLAFATNTALSGSGILIYLTFQVTSAYTSGTNYSTGDVLFNEVLPGLGNNKYFDVIPLPALTVSPSTGEVVAGETLQFSVAGATGPIIWSTSNATMASISSSGLLTANRSGVITVTATDAIGATGNSGNIQIYDTRVNIANGLASFGSFYNLPVIMGNLPSGEAVFAIQGNISFKTPQLTFIGIITAGTNTDGWSVSQFSSGNSVSFALAGTNSFNEAGTMFYLRFQLNGSLGVGQSAWVNFNSFNLNEGVPLPKLVNGSITVTNQVPGTLAHSFAVGWSGISSYIIPSNPNVVAIFAPVVADLEILYNMAGQIYAPFLGINTLVNWEQQKGYIIKSLSTQTVTFDGFYNSNRAISVTSGWNLIPVISECPANPALLGAAISGFKIIKQVAGVGIYWPAFGINTLGNLQPGFAYYLYSTSSGSFTYPACPKTSDISNHEPSIYTNPWNEISPTPESHIVLIKSAAYTNLYLKEGSFIGAFNFEDKCVGSVKLEDLEANLVITVFGNDYYGNRQSGMAEGSPIVFKTYNPENSETQKLEAEFDVTFPNGGTYVSQGVSAVSVLKFSNNGFGNNNHAQVGIFPNPATGAVFISTPGNLSGIIEISDMKGRIVKNFQIESLNTELNLSDLSKGIYVVKIISDVEIFTRKIILR